MSVRILELNGFFGGTLVSGLVGGFCGIFGAKHSPDDEPPLVVGGTGRQVMDAVSSLGGLSGLCRSPLFNTLRYDSCLLQIALDRLLLRAGVRLSLYTAITDAGAEDGRVVYVDTWSKSGRERIFPRIVSDATGERPRLDDGRAVRKTRRSCSRRPSTFAWAASTRRLERCRTSTRSAGKSPAARERDPEI
jgi:hypothetical protein